MTGRLSLVFLLFYVFLDRTHADPHPVTQCAAKGLASMATPPKMADLAGTWYVYATNYKSWEYELKCMVCQMKATGELQCILIRKIQQGFVTQETYEYVTTKLTYNAATKTFKTSGAGLLTKAEFVVTKYDKAKSSIVIGLCDGKFIPFSMHYYKAEVALGMGGDLSKLTDITTGKTDIEYKDKCYKVTFDFSKPVGISRGTKASTARDLAIFKGKGDGEACVSSVQCTVTDQECTSKKCACKAGKIYDKTKKACVGAKKYDEPCATDAECGGENQMCKSKKCACKDTAVYDKTNKKCVLKMKYDQACTINEQCADPEQQCSAAKKCECKPKFKYDATQKKCLAVAAYNAACTSNVQCIGEEQECKTKCVCKATAIYDGASKKCLAKKKYDEDCAVKEQCTGTNQDCTAKKCKCKTNFAYDKAKGCLEAKKYNEVCVASGQCNGGDQECKGGKCACIAGATYDAGLKKCLGKKKHGQECFVKSQCSDANQDCTGSPKKACACVTGFKYVPAKTACLKEAGNGEACEYNEQCKVKDQECKDKKCKCKAPKIFAGICGDVPKGYKQSTSEPGNYLRRMPMEMTIQEAVTECKSHVSGISNLVQIKSEKKNAEVQKMIKDRDPVWIGVAQNSDGKTYTRPDLTSFTVDDKSYQNWYNDDSKDFGGNPKDKCLCIYMYPVDGKWEDTKCEEKHGVVCEIRPK